MAQANSYPQIPVKVWWGIRDLIRSSPNASYDQASLGAALGVQPAAARQYFAELQRVGILDDTGKATSLGLEWRIDESYQQATRKILEKTYPESLIAIASPESGGRETAANWFMQQGLGQGSAKNKAATYFLIGSPSPGPSPDTSSKKTTGKTKLSAKVTKPKTKVQDGVGNNDEVQKGDVVQSIPLNLNVQIHISAEADEKQINSIFAAMRRYLRDD